MQALTYRKAGWPAVGKQQRVGSPANFDACAQQHWTKVPNNASNFRRDDVWDNIVSLHSERWRALSSKTCCSFFQQDSVVTVTVTVTYCDLAAVPGCQPGRLHHNCDTMLCGSVLPCQCRQFLPCRIASTTLPHVSIGFS